MVAKVLEPGADGHALVEVIRVLKGDTEPGQRVSMRLYAAEKKRGQILVLSDPEFNFAPTFEALDLEFESEIRWLIERAPVRTIGGAILRLQGLSCESRRAGAWFLAQTTTFPAGRILEAIEASRMAGDDRRYETRCLIDALTLRPHPAAAIWLRREVEAWLVGESEAVDGEKLVAYPSKRGSFLTALVGACGSTWSPMFFQEGRDRPAEVHALRKDLEARLLQRLPTLDPASQADVTYALVWTEATTAAEVLERLSGGATRQGFALGMLRVGRAHDRICAWDAAGEAWRAAQVVATDPEVITWLAEALTARR